MNALTTAQTATAVFHAGRVRAGARVSVTPAGLLAIGGLVAAILLSVPPIVRAAGEARRNGAGGTGRAVSRSSARG